MKKFIFLLLSIHNSFAFVYDLCVVGATSGLGRELVFQSICDRDKSVIALTSNKNNKINTPYRGNTFDYEETNKTISHPNLFIESYWNNDIPTFKHIVFCTSAKPFEKDYSDSLTNKLLHQIPNTCKTISLVSAYGVGDSLDGANIGIKVMNDLYLKDVYRAKNEQENIISSFNNPNIIKNIYRPRALSYGDTLLYSIPRSKLATEILNSMNL